MISQQLGCLITRSRSMHISRNSLAFIMHPSLCMVTSLVTEDLKRCFLWMCHKHLLESYRTTPSFQRHSPPILVSKHLLPVSMGGQVQALKGPMGRKMPVLRVCPPCPETTKLKCMYHHKRGRIYILLFALSVVSKLWRMQATMLANYRLVTGSLLCPMEVYHAANLTNKTNKTG